MDDVSAELASVVEAVRGGDREAFSRLYSATSSQVYGLIRTIISDAEAAQQLLQEVYVAVWNRSQTYNKAVCTPTTWILSLARTLATIYNRQHLTPRG